MTVRTRVAPSPTGDPHVGTAYIALFNLAFAKSQGGQFLLRIEDTDQARSTPESEQQIMDSLRWLGLDWDEGPDVGGDKGPYRQSERRDIYAEHAQILLDKGHAFRCFCSSERLDALRAEQAANKQASGYDGHCLHLSEDDVQAKLAAGEEHVVRMKIPAEGTCKFDDMLRGTIEIDWSQVDMQVLVKGDGMPTYHLANVVDDHLMEITHVIRGEEWINSAPKHQLLYKYFGWEMPVLCHMPLLRNPDKSKLSKRKNPTSITYYRDAGYLPEVLLNYLGRMGWSMPDEREKFSLQDMLENFDITRVSLGGPIFDQEKLSWLNASWIREDLSAEEFADRLHGWLLNKDFIMKFLPFAQGRVERLSDFAPMAAFMFSGMLDLGAEDFAHKKLEEAEVKKVLQFTLWRLEQLRQWNKGNIFNEIKTLSKEMGLKLGDFNHPIFVAIAGTPNSWSVMDSMEILGADMTRARLRHAVAVLGGVSKKEGKRLEKEFKALGAEAS
ncbi:glutamyl-tRNA synthetase [Endozoicomonas montiporae]|uniref:Glutamate--tRNA ligase n=2 Tax=Endozoicomonas montiporae TaxID=1027273 RepID=A0A081N4Y2_9GAMM|nr:glutamate--tRNA ligase [Endozoicomonas montiporae]AMO57626.1 glutamyl-tRNA synthetase [Endozoicomonas montiporae CL-33]KEQ13505.1 glutamyl-tRNA synthetase [Endozoicomonas montiporae]